MELNDKTLKSLAASLNMRQMRQEIIASNVANSETPDYKSKRLDFEEALARAIDLDKSQAMKTSDEKHYNVGGGGFKSLSPQVYEDPNGDIGVDGNTVDRDKEMAKMAENKILFDASIQLFNKKMGLLKYILNSEK